MRGYCVSVILVSVGLFYLNSSYARILCLGLSYPQVFHARLPIRHGHPVRSAVSKNLAFWRLLTPWGKKQICIELKVHAFWCFTYLQRGPSDECNYNVATCVHNHILCYGYLRVLTPMRLVLYIVHEMPFWKTKWKTKLFERKKTSLCYQKEQYRISDLRA